MWMHSYQSGRAAASRLIVATLQEVYIYIYIFISRNIYIYIYMHMDLVQYL
jgi:hypothetical protein